MNVDIVIKNYRCFEDTTPVRFRVRNGVTAFVGRNNSGKSTLLRFFYEFREVFRALSTRGGALEKIVTGNRAGMQIKWPVADVDEIFCNRNDRDITVELRIRDEVDEVAPDPRPAAVVTNVLITVTRDRGWTVAFPGHFDSTAWGPSFRLAEAYLESGSHSPLNLSAVYSVCAGLTSTLYVPAFRNMVNLGAQSSYFDIEVGQAALAKWRALKSAERGRKFLKAALAVEQDLKSIFGFTDLTLNALDEDRSLQAIVDGRPYQLTDIGGGFAEFFMILSTAAAAQQPPALILIDEPESHLHPPLQREFLLRLRAYSTVGVLMATHSIGLARAIAAATYSVRGESGQPSEVVEFERTSRLSEFLGEVSFDGYRQIGVNKVVLVEGPSDLTAIQQLMRKLGKEHQVLLLPLGGAGMINGNVEDQLVEVKRITADVHALIDSERSTAGAPLAQNRQDFMKACQAAGVRCTVLDRRALDNYFPERAIQASRGAQFHAPGPYERFESTTPRWDKHDHWRIAKEMTDDEVKQTGDLWHFLSSI